MFRGVCKLKLRTLRGEGASKTNESVQGGGVQKSMKLSETTELQVILGQN